MRKLLLALLLLGAVPAHAADNYSATAGTGLTFAAKDVAGGGILYPWSIIANSAGAEIFTAVSPGFVDPATAANWGLGATGAAVPSKAHYIGINSGGNLVGWTGSVTQGGTWNVGQTGTWTVQPGNTANTTPWLTTINQGGNSAAVSASNALKVDGSAVNQPVTQSGTWTVQPGNTANTTAWKVDGSAVTQPVSAASLPLPTGAATATNQTNVAGPVAAGTAAANSQLVGAVFNSTAPTLTNGQQAAVQVSSRGGLQRGSEYPMGAVAEEASATGTTAATAATLATSVAGTTYICGFSIRANATAAATGNATVAGFTTTLNFSQWTSPNASGIGITEEIFTPCKPASAANTTIVITSAAPGAGGVVSVAAWGYLLTP